MDDTFVLHRGSRPLLVSMPHVGTVIPEALAPRLVQRALAVEDTDWHLEQVYAFAREVGAGFIVPRYSRYVVDLNRPPGNEPMYPGANNTELAPTRFFSGDALYRSGQAPDAAETAARVETWWRPYHQALAAEVARLRAEHGHVVLWDAHSIKSRQPWLFEGRLPDLNLGTASGTSCAPGLRARLAEVLESQGDFSHVTDGRFKGGYITRHYGSPAEGIHAVQLEMCWSTYMEELPPYRPDEVRLTRLVPVLRALLDACLSWRMDA